MPRFLWQNSLVKTILINQNYSFLRYIRTIAKRDVGPKLVDAKVKTVTKYDDTEHIESYKDFIKSVEKKGLGDEYEIEKEFLNEDYHGDVIERCDKYFEEHEREEKTLNSLIKKKIVGRKYFKLDRETNLLTHAAKEQVRFLHKSNPLDWNCKALSECFPVSEEGVKKLLKSNFVLTCPERIKEHDENVAELWKILKSGKPTNLISPVTQKLYKEGKLIDDYFSGNPNLPTEPPSKIVLEVKKKKKIGEFSAIVQTYTEYQKKKLLTEKKDTNENQVILRDASAVQAVHGKKEIDYKKIRQYKYASEEADDRDPEVYPSRRKPKSDMSEIPFTQFKEILKDETSARLKHKKKDDYDEFILKETSKTEQKYSAEKPHSSPDYFIKISKYDKNKNVDAMFEKCKNTTEIYKFDEKLGYQHPYGKKVKNKIKPQHLQRNGKLYKVGHCVYDDDGEFLYKVPT